MHRDCSRKFAVRMKYLNAVRRHVEIALFIRAHAAGHAVDLRGENALVRGVAFLIEVIGADGVLVGRGYIERAPVRRERDAIGTRGPLRREFHRPLGRNVVDAIEIELAMVLLLAERRVGEIDVFRFADRDAARRVELLAVPFGCDGFDLSVLRRARDAAGAGFASVEAVVSIEGIAARPVGVGAKDLGVMTRDPFEQAVTRDVAEDQIVSDRRPGRTLRVHVVLGGEVEFDVGEILRGKKRQPPTGCRTGAQARDAPHHLLSLRLMLLTTCLTPFTPFVSFAARSFCLVFSTCPLSVTIPCFTSTVSAPPLTI